MKVRYLRGLALVGVMAFVVSGASAFASPKAPAKNLTFKQGPDSVFGGTGGTRFDGYYDKTAKRVYFLGMRQGDDSTSGEVWYYDVASKSYVDTGTSMVNPVSNYGIAALTNKNGVLGLYIFGGRDANATIVKDVQVYNPATNAASELAKADWYPGKTPLGCIPLPAMGVAQLGNKAYVMGGSSFSSAGCQDDNSAQTWIFNPTKAKGAKWSKGPKLNMARGYITPAVLGGKIYAIGGDVNDAGTLTAQSIVENWNGDPTSTWKDGAVADLTEPCDESQAFGFDSGPLQNTITLVGCGQWPNDLPDVLQYNSTNDSWSTVGTLNESRRNHAGANIGSNKTPKLYVVGGYGADGATVETTSEIGTVSTNGTWVFRPSAPSHASTGRASVA